MLVRCPVFENKIAQPDADKCPIFVIIVVFSSSKQITVLALHPIFHLLTVVLSVALWLEKGDCPEIVTS